MACDTPDQASCHPTAGTSCTPGVSPASTIVNSKLTSVRCAHSAFCAASIPASARYLKDHRQESNRSIRCANTCMPFAAVTPARA
eukprot:1158110-Pelagomonas_calceolata.AAC.1